MSSGNSAEYQYAHDREWDESIQSLYPDTRYLNISREVELTLSRAKARQSQEDPNMLVRAGEVVGLYPSAVIPFIPHVPRAPKPPKMHGVLKRYEIAKNSLLEAITLGIRFRSERNGNGIYFGAEAEDGVFYGVHTNTFQTTYQETSESALTAFHTIKRYPSDWSLDEEVEGPRQFSPEIFELVKPPEGLLIISGVTSKGLGHVQTKEINKITAGILEGLDN